MIEYKKSNRNSISVIIRYMIVCITAAIQYYQFQFATLGSTSQILEQKFSLLFLNIVMIIFFNLLVSILTKNRIGISIFITSTIITIWSIAHYYVGKFHGGPLFFSVFANAKTAFNVIGEYKFEITQTVVRLLICYFLQILLSIITFVLERKGISCKKRYVIGTLILNFLIIYTLLLSPVAITEGQMLQWSWVHSIKENGFMVCLLNDIGNLVNPYIKPENYDVKKIRIKETTSDVSEQNLPDVILILNETFYDLDVYTDISANSNYFAEFYQLENAALGYAVVPGIGGGTNNSEYELLVSNSMMLLRNEAPFNYIDFSKTNNSAFQYFNSLGYSTYAFHGVDADNYSRRRAYPEMGAENVFLGWDAWEYSLYGNRRRLDEDEYKFLIEQNESSNSLPKFMYLLTFQNHGGWEENEASYDTVMTQNNYGDLTDDINEYLTSVSMSVEAFKKMTDYYKNIDKPVMICMVGDHAPSFINQLPTDLNEEEKELYARLVPYVIWSNYDTTFEDYPEYISLTDLLPMIVQTAELPLTSYYNTILELQKEIPVRTSYGKYYDEELNELDIKENTETDELLEQYYYMEYNSLEAGDNYRQELFTPYIE